MSLVHALSVSRTPALGFGALGYFWGSFAALAPPIKAQIGASDATFGLVLLGTAFGLATTLWLAPRFDARMGARAQQVSTLMLVAVFCLPGMMQTPLSLFFVMVATGLVSGLHDVVVNARVSELEARHDAPLMNANHGAFSLFYAIGAVGAGVGRETGLSPSEILGVASLVGLGIAAMTHPQTGATVAGDGPPVPLTFSLLGLFGGIVLLAFMAEAAVESWSALHIERSLGGRAAEGALGPAFLGLTMAAGRFWGQALTARISETRMIEIATVMTIVGLGVASFAATPPQAYVGFAIFGLGVSVIGPLGLALVGRLAPPALRTAAIARVAVMGFFGFFVAPSVMGFVAHFASLAAAFLVIAALLGLLPVLTVALKRRHRL